MLWVNIDIPTKRYVIHASHFCTYVLRKVETNYKGINEVKRDGGWVSFNTRAEVLSNFNRQFSNYNLIEHC